MPRISLLAVLLATLATAAFAQDAQAPTAKRTELALHVDPTGAKGRTLGLARVDVPAGAELTRHRHTGTQIAHVEHGTLTYTVSAGSVTVRSGEADTTRVVRRIKAGQTGSIKAGQWIVEQPSVVHRAANRGTKSVVIYLATLLPNGDPPSVPAR